MTLSSGTHAFTGQIAGMGFADGTRVVVGRWTHSPFGPFTDVMVERADGTRILLAPTDEIAGTVSDLYSFDEVEVVPVSARIHDRALDLSAGPLELRATVGGRTALGRALSAVPTALSKKSWWSRVTDPVARAVLDGVRTKGTTANGLAATYGATDVHAIETATATWDGKDLGAMGPVQPPVRFGFGSTPPEPSLTSITTTIEVPEPEPLTGVIDCWGMGALREKQAREAAAARTGQAGSVPTREEHRMTAQSDEGHTGLDRDNNQRPEINPEGNDEHTRGDAFQERMEELTDAAKDDDQA